MSKTAPDNNSLDSLAKKVNFSLENTAIPATNSDYENDEYLHEDPVVLTDKLIQKPKLNFKDDVLERLKSEPIFKQELLITDDDVDFEVEKDKREARRELFPKCSIFIVYSILFTARILSNNLYKISGIQEEIKNQSLLLFTALYSIAIILLIKFTYDAIKRARLAYPYSRILLLKRHVDTKKQELFWKTQEMYYNYRLDEKEQNDWLTLMKNTELNSMVHGSDSLRRSRLTSVSVRPSVKLEKMKTGEKRANEHKITKILKEIEKEKEHDKLIEKIDSEINRNSKIRFDKEIRDTDEGCDHLNKTDGQRRRSALKSNADQQQQKLPENIV